MNTIYLIRHGENTANITKEFSYKRVDYSLTAKGIQQAEQTAAYFKDKDIHEIYTSPLKRARETAGIIAAELQLPITVMEHFREVNVGTLEDLPPTAENWGLHERVVQDWRAGKHETTFPGGENYLTLLARMRAGLLDISRNKNNRNIIVVGHGGIFTGTIRDICSITDRDHFTIAENHNCAITEIALSTHEDRVEGTLKSWASCMHLHGYAAEVVTATPQFIENV